MKVKQLNVDCYGCRADLNNTKEIIRQIEKSVKKAGAKILGISAKNYPIHGLTAVVFLAESHILVSTYPEFGYTVVEIFMCNDKISPEKCWGEIKKYLRPSVIRKHMWYHYIASSPREAKV